MSNDEIKKNKINKKKDSKEKIIIKKVRIKFEKDIKGWIILDWMTKLKRKINFIKELKKKPSKRMMIKSKKVIFLLLKDEIENVWKFTKKDKEQMEKKRRRKKSWLNLKNSKMKSLDSRIQLKINKKILQKNQEQKWNK